MRRTKTPIIGIAGGIASGKSFITGHLKRMGAAVVSADEAAHEVLELEEVKREAQQRWGDAIFGADGQIDRKALGQIVFAPPPDGPLEREFLERLTHPRIGEIIRRQIIELAEQGSAAAIVLDLPLLFESGWNKICDKIVFVDAPRRLRESRAKERGWSREEFARRETVQQSPETKRELADVVIDNSGSPESAQAQIERFWPSLIDSSAPG
ncbi:MAG: dephospho-CoA kinase [Pirellulales bacterium]